VLTAARSLFGRRGYAQTSVDEIADAARVTKGAIYHNLDGKEALIRAVHAEVDPSTVAAAIGEFVPDASAVTASYASRP
jgi:AcrR family transcriptional regulator